MDLASDETGNSGDATPFTSPILSKHDDAKPAARRVWGSIVLALLCIAVVTGVLWLGESTDSKVSLATPEGAHSTDLVAPSVSPAPASAPERATLDLGNGFTYTRISSLEAFKRQYPDAICIGDGPTCASEQAATEACGSLLCTDGIFGFRNGQSTGLLVRPDPIAARRIVDSTFQAYGDPDLFERTQIAAIESHYLSWFIKNGTFTVTLHSGHNVYGRPIADPVSLQFREGEEKPILSGTKIPQASPGVLMLIGEWEKANGSCRGLSPSDPNMKAACELRDLVLGPRLAAASYCYGRKGEFGFEASWHACGPRSCKPGLC